MSIIIVGVGSGDFSNMQQLDGDDGLLKLGNQTAMRDIVQFVPFSKFANMDYSALAEETLAEIPQQVSEYFSSMNIRPREAIRVHTAANINNLMQQQQPLPQQPQAPPQQPQQQPAYPSVAPTATAPPQAPSAPVNAYDAASAPPFNPEASPSAQPAATASAPSAPQTVYNI